jgi:hypothetical protein
MKRALTIAAIALFVPFSAFAGSVGTGVEVLHMLLGVTWYSSGPHYPGALLHDAHPYLNMSLSDGQALCEQDKAEFMAIFAHGASYKVLDASCTEAIPSELEQH